MSIRVRLKLLPGLVLAALALGALPSTSEAQFGKRLKDAVKRTAEDKAIQKATAEESNAIDDAIEGGGEAKPDSAPAGGTAEPAAAGGPAPKKAGEGAFVNFDFVPGDRVLFYDDYSADNVGDFPRRL
jgi:OOP family OmpA-OmpF porin